MQPETPISRRPSRPPLTARQPAARGPAAPVDQRHHLTPEGDDVVIRLDGERTGSSVQPITVAVVNDTELVVCGVAAMLARHRERVTVVDAVAGGLPDGRAQVVLLDTFAVGSDAECRARRIIEQDLAAHIVIFTWDVRRITEELMRLPRVNGVVSKSVTADQLLDAIEAVVAGASVVIHGAPPERSSELVPTERLSEREAQVAALMAQGRTNIEIATSLVVSPETVKTYASRLYSKLGARNRAQVAAWVADGGLASGTYGGERH